MTASMKGLATLNLSLGMANYFSSNPPFEGEDSGGLSINALALVKKGQLHIFGAAFLALGGSSRSTFSNLYASVRV